MAAAQIGLTEKNSAHVSIEAGRTERPTCDRAGLDLSAEKAEPGRRSPPGRVLTERGATRKTYLPSGRWEDNVSSTLKLVRQETTEYDFSSIIFLSHVS